MLVITTSNFMWFYESDSDFSSYLHSLAQSCTASNFTWVNKVRLKMQYVKQHEDIFWNYKWISLLKTNERSILQTAFV